MLVRRFLRENEWVVHDGPFKGMRYIAKSSGSALLPKLLGTYEQELNLAIEEAISRSPKLVLDVGCAEGYYAVGFARRLPEVTVLGYDIDSHAKASCLELAKANEVDSRVQVLGLCGHDELRKRITPATLLICDCEGFEWELLDVEQVPSLASVDMIVELHGKSGEECRQEIENRFSSTHILQFFEAEPRSGEFCHVLQNWSYADQALASNELRMDGYWWVWAKARSWC